MLLDNPFHINDLPQGNDGDFSPIPDDWYPVTIHGCELRSTRSGGKMLVFRFDVTGDKFAGRVIWHNCNIENASAKAEEIGRAQLRSIMSAAGMSSIVDTDQFTGRKLSIYVETEQSEQYGDKNVAKKFKALDGGSPMPTPAQPAKTEQVKQASDDAAPWERF